MNDFAFDDEIKRRISEIEADPEALGPRFNRLDYISVCAAIFVGFVILFIGGN
jgi:hypothetical protein